MKEKLRKGERKRESCQERCFRENQNKSSLWRNRKIRITLMELNLITLSIEKEGFLPSYIFITYLYRFSL